MFQYNRNKPLLIAGFGNLLLSDEGAGVTAIQELSKLSLPDNVILLDGGTIGIDTISWLNDFSQVILIDCVRSNKNDPIVEFNLEDIKINKNDNLFSVHEVNLNTVFNLMNTLNMKIPDILIYGIKPEKANYGIGISDKVWDSIHIIIGKIYKMLTQKSLSILIMI